MQMKTILVLAPTPVLPDSIRGLLPLDEYRLLHLAEPGDFEPLARNPSLNTCIVDAEEGDIRALWTIDRLRQLAPSMPIIVYKGAAWEWEEEAYVKGVSAVVSKPVRAQVLLSMLERLCKGAPGAFSGYPGPGFRAVADHMAGSGSMMAGAAATACQQSMMQQALQLLSGLSGAPSPSLSAESMLGQLPPFVREMLGAGMGRVPFQAQPAGGQTIYNFNTVNNITVAHPVPQQQGGWLEFVQRMVQDRAREEQLCRLQQQAEVHTQFSSPHPTACSQPQEGFQGVLRRVGLQDLLQMECLSRHSTLLEITTKEVRGLLYIFEGQIIHAEASGRTGAEAFNFLMSLSGGEFVQKPYANPPQRTITDSWEFLLMEAARQCDEASQNALPPAETKRLPQAMSTAPGWGNAPLCQIPAGCLPMAAGA